MHCGTHLCACHSTGNMLQRWSWVWLQLVACFILCQIISCKEWFPFCWWKNIRNISWCFSWLRRLLTSFVCIMWAMGLQLYPCWLVLVALNHLYTTWVPLVCSSSCRNVEICKLCHLVACALGTFLLLVGKVKLLGSTSLVTRLFSYLCGLLFSSIIRSCPAFCNLIYRRTLGLPILCLREFTQFCLHCLNGFHLTFSFYCCSFRGAFYRNLT